MAGIVVQVLGNDLERALRGFRKKILQSGILKEAKDRMFYLKPSESKKLKRQRAEHRRRKTRAKAKQWLQADQGR